MSYRFLSNKNRTGFSMGFTLVEMLVVISIFTIITGVTMANLPAFRDKTTLDLIAQEIAITIRQAQVYGIGTREAESAGLEFTSYGIYFDPNNSSGSGLDKKSLYLYADKKNPESSPAGVVGFSDDDGSVVEEFVIRGGAEITQLLSCSGTPCTFPPAVNATNLSTLDIFFQRFYPDAKFVDIVPAPNYIKIVIQSTRDVNNKREIEVWSTGQISVKTL